MFLALRTGTSLPEATPGPLLDRLLIHDDALNKFANPRRGHEIKALERGVTLSDNNENHGTASRNNHEAQTSRFALTWDVLCVS
jgi:hypothetical protein